MDDLRDKFAMAAMQGLLSAGITDRGLIASAAYEQADAMIAERESGSVDSVASAKAQLIQAIEWEHNITFKNGEVFCIKHLIEFLRTGFIPEVGE